MKVNKVKSITMTIIAILVVTFIVNFNSNLIPITVSADDKTDAFDAITLAYEKIELASSRGLNVATQISLLNDALNDYNQGRYIDAFNKAHEVIDQTDELLDNLTNGRLFPYILIPVNAILIVVVIVFFGRNILDWFKGRRDEEFLDMEINYDQPEEEVEIIEEKKDK